MVTKSRTFAVGERVSVVIEIKNGADVAHAPFYVDFNPKVLRFESGEEGSFLGRDGKQPVFVSAATSDGASVAVGLSRLGRVQGITGSGDLCVLHFTAVNPGDAALGFSKAVVKNSRDQEIPSSFEPALVVVQ